MNGDTLYSIGELARRTGLTVKTIRFYSDSGIVAPTERSPAGYRRDEATGAAALLLADRWTGLRSEASRMLSSASWPTKGPSRPVGSVTAMDHDRVLEAFRRECEALTDAMSGVSEAEWNLPTRCAPWTVRDLLGHVCVVIDWLPGMLDAPAPSDADVSAVEYYRPDDRFSPRTNSARIALAQDRAAEPAGGAFADDFTAVWRLVDRLCRSQPAGRTVRTRHGDAMLLSEFLLTRVVEVAVHGLDLADALGREPWLTAPAGDAVLELLLGTEHVAAVDTLGWSRPHFLRRATGREPLDGSEAGQIEQLGIRWLALG